MKRGSGEFLKTSTRRSSRGATTTRTGSGFESPDTSHRAGTRHLLTSRTKWSCPRVVRVTSGQKSTHVVGTPVAGCAAWLTVTSVRTKAATDADLDMNWTRASIVPRARASERLLREKRSLVAIVLVELRLTELRLT
jgi:hypothetical protein